MSPVEVIDIGIEILSAAEQIREYIAKMRAAGQLTPEQLQRVEDLLPSVSESGALAEKLSGS